MHGWLVAVLNLLNMGAGPVEEEVAAPRTLAGAWAVPTVTGAWAVPTVAGNWDSED